MIDVPVASTQNAEQRFEAPSHLFVKAGPAL
jgi:hypothetical protein